MPNSAVSDLGLSCLLITLLGYQDKNELLIIMVKSNIEVNEQK